MKPHDYELVTRTEWAEDDLSIHPFQRGTFWQKKRCKNCNAEMTEHGPLNNGLGLYGSSIPSSWCCGENVPKLLGLEPPRRLI